MYSTELESVRAKVNVQHQPPVNILGCSYFARSDGQFTNVSRQYYMWQSRVEFEGYSVAYFDRIVAFEAPYR